MARELIGIFIEQYRKQDVVDIVFSKIQRLPSMDLWLITHDYEMEKYITYQFVGMFKHFRAESFECE